MSTLSCGKGFASMESPPTPSPSPLPPLRTGGTVDKWGGWHYDRASYLCPFGKPTLCSFGRFFRHVNRSGTVVITNKKTQIVARPRQCVGVVPETPEISRGRRRPQHSAGELAEQAAVRWNLRGCGKTLSSRPGEICFFFEQN